MGRLMASFMILTILLPLSWISNVTQNAIVSDWQLGHAVRFSVV